MFCEPVDAFVTHSDAFVTHCDAYVTHGETFVNRDATVNSHFLYSNPRHDYAHYNNQNLDRPKVDQTVCGYKCRLRRLHHCASRRSRLSNFVAKFEEDNVALVIWK